MPLVCPHCRTPVPPGDANGQALICAGCGSSFRHASDTTAGWSETRQTLGKFELLEEVGAGGFGSVYKARDLELGRTVAIKIPRPGSGGSSGDADRFLREARSVAQLRHPSIVPVFEIGQDSGRPYLVSEFIHGITLADRLTGERLSPHAAADLVARVADALDYAHAQGVIHRDVKPSNIMLEVEERGQRTEAGKSGRGAAPADDVGAFTPRLMDFGLAKRDTGEITMTVEGQVLGTPAYMSPEQARGESHSVDGRSDVYSLGVILYQLLTGELPFQGNARMLLHHVLHDEPKPPRSRDPKVPRDLETVCLKAMAKEPGRRYARAGDLAADLRRFLSDDPILARPVSLREKFWRRVRRNPAVYGLAGAVIVLVGVIIAVLVNASKPTPGASDNIAPDTSADDLLKIVTDLDRTDPGWRLEELERKRPTIPDEENGATHIKKFRKAVDDLAVNSLEGVWWRSDHSDRIFAVPPWPPHAPIPETHLKPLREELAGVQSLVPLARKMTEFPRGRIATPYRRDVVSTMSPDHFMGIHLVKLLAMDGVMQLYEGRRDQALIDCRAMWNVSRVYVDDPIPLTQVQRTVVVRATLRVFERMLAHGECAEGELAEFQRYVEEATRVPVFSTIMRGERAMLHYFLSAVASGDILDSNLNLFELLGIKDRSQLPSTKDVRRAHAWLLEYTTEGVGIAHQPPERWVALLRPYDEKRSAVPLPGHPLVKMFLIDPFTGDADKPSLASGMAARVTLHLAELRTAQATLAIERYRLAHGSWPRDLAALVPTYLNDVPTDPFDGQPVRYHRTADGVVVYCVGPDRTDHQGKLERSAKLADGQDVGFQLWDVDKRR